MAESRIKTTATLLTKSDSGENGLLLTLLSADFGLLKAHMRLSRKSARPVPDLFDTASLQLNRAKTGGLWFVDEYIVQNRRPKIGSNYRSLLYACRYSLLLAENFFDNSEGALRLTELHKALDAWETGNHPEVIYFKALYLFALRHGIPVKEEWLASLEKSGSSAGTVLRKPLKLQNHPPQTTEKWIASLEDYLRLRHDLILPQ